MDNIFNYTLNELEDKLVSLGLKKFIASQIYDWIYKKYIKSFEVMSNLSSATIKTLNENFVFGNLKIAKINKSDKDDTIKFLYELSDKNIIEMAVIEFEFGYSGCVSTQIGCNMGCKFCASGLNKKKRNLETFEIVQELLIANEYLEKNNLKKMGSTSFMGIGEPMDNFDNLVHAVKIIHEPKGINLGWRNFTFSTCGVANKIVTLAQTLPQCNLAISLHAPNDTIRNQIMPINQAFNIKTLIAAAVKYTQIVNHDITFQYTMIKDVNDSELNALELAKLLQNINCHVILIEYNPVKEFSFKTSKNINKFKTILEKNRISVSLRKNKGRNIDAACGTMRSSYEAKK